jgi:hypothetical protein
MLLLAACDEEQSYLIVTVDRRPAVHDAATLKVTLSNAGTMLTKDLPIDDAMFPLTFSLSAPGRSGDLTIGIDALDSANTLVGRGTGNTNLTEMMASVLLDSADFVVNSELANDQFLTTDFEAVGFQLAGISNGQWLATYRDECTTCNIFARRFDSTGLPVVSELAAGDISFNVNTKPTTNAAMSAAASSNDTTLVVWDYSQSGGTGRGVECRAISATGAGATGEIAVAGPTENSDVISVTGLSNGNFVIVWDLFQSTYTVRSAVVTKACELVGTVVTASDTGFSAQRPHVAANNNVILYSWVNPGATGGVRIRTAQLSGAFNGTEALLVPNTSSQEIEHVRVSKWGAGFAVAARWASNNQDDPGKIEVYRTTAAGQLMGTPILITDQSRSDFASSKGFSLAERPDGALMVVWHVCETGPGLCDVYGRVLRPTGAQVGDPFVIPTSVASEQINPSVIALQDTFVAAWNDASGEEPDESGTAVRARIVYPLYDDARGVHGATCGASSPGAPACNDGLACAMGSDGVQRCYAKCVPPSCPGGGTCSTVDETTSACTF